MTSPPLTIGVLAFTAAVASASLFAGDPGPFDQAAAITVFVGIVIAGLTGLVGLVLARAPWGRWTLFASLCVPLTLAATAGSHGWWIALAVGAIAAVGLLGPWLTLWVRHEPAAEAPGPVVVALMAVAPAATLFVGAAALYALRTAHVVLIAVAVVSSWAYGRGIPGALWGLRIAFPAAGVYAIVSTQGAGTIPLAIAVAGITIAAWLPHARRATAIVTPPLPEPVRRTQRSTDDAGK